MAKVVADILRLIAELRPLRSRQLRNEVQFVARSTKDNGRPAS
jgi:hypothetical protein